MRGRVPRDAADWPLPPSLLSGPPPPVHSAVWCTARKWNSIVGRLGIFVLLTSQPRLCGDPDGVLITGSPLINYHRNKTILSANNTPLSQTHWLKGIKARFFPMDETKFSLNWSTKPPEYPTPKYLRNHCRSFSFWCELKKILFKNCTNTYEK